MDKERSKEDYKSLLDNKYPDFMIGVDECGRGSLAGPMVICAVAWFPWFRDIPIKDSKRMGRKQIHETANQIKSVLGAPYVLCSIEPAHIDALGREKCWDEGVVHAIQMVRWKYDEHSNSIAIIDGNRTPSMRTSVEWGVYAFPKADQFCTAVQAAAVIAKSYQLEVMAAQHQLYPKYKLNKNAGYGTKEHFAALKEYGPSPIHRMSFAPMKEVGNGVCADKNGERPDGTHFSRHLVGAEKDEQEHGKVVRRDSGGKKRGR